MLDILNKLYNWFNRRNIVDYHFDIEYPEYTSKELIDRFKDTISKATVVKKEKERAVNQSVLVNKGTLSSSYQGYQGYQGHQVLMGYQGYQGSQGHQVLMGYQGYQGSQGHQVLMGYQGYQGSQGALKQEPTVNAEIKSMVDYAIHTSIIIPKYYGSWEIKTKLSGYVPLVGVIDKESAYKYFADPLNEWHLGYLIHHCKPDLQKVFENHPLLASNLN